MRWHHLPMFLFVITMLAVALGGAVRIHNAGESCPDWPRCFGSWGFDISEEEQGVWYDENPTEIDSRGDQHRYSTGDIFLEWSHRILTGLILGPLCILQWAVAFRRRARMPSVHKATAAALVLVIVQGALGALTVRYDNIHWSVAAHLVLALSLALSLLWAWIRWMEAEGVLPGWMKVATGPSLRTRLADMSLATLVVLVFGAFVASTPNANEACSVGSFSAWPLCQGSLFASLLENLQFAHRLAAVVVLGWLVWNLVGMERGTVRRLLHAGLGLYVLNLVLGGVYILTWDDGFIEALSLLHLLLGSTSFLCIAFAALLVRNASSEEEE